MRTDPDQLDKIDEDKEDKAEDRVINIRTGKITNLREKIPQKKNGKL